MTAANRTDQEMRGGRVALWFALLGGGAAWVVHLMGAWAISEFGCVGGMDHRALVGSIVGVSVVTFAMALAATAVGWTGDDPRRKGMSEPARYMARAGWITSGVFAFIILVESIPIFFYLRDC